MARRFTVILILALTTAAASAANAQVQSTAALRQAVAQADGRVIVTLKSGRGAAIRAPGSPPIAAAEMTAIQGRLEVRTAMQVHSQVPMIGALVATVSDAGLAQLAADTNVAAIEPDTKTYLMESVSSKTTRPTRVPADAIPWGVTDVGAPAAWAAGYTGNGVKVGIIDTGIEYNHPDLVVVGGYDFVYGSAAASSYTDNISSCDGHGTHVAGTVAARQNGIGVVGIAPNASLYALKVFADFGSGCFAYLSSQISAIQWAATNHLDVVNISIGNSNSPAFASAIASANAAGVVIVAAAGNSGGAGIAYPAASPGAIAVAALNSDNSVAGYSSSGPEMWVSGPGSGVTSTVPGGGYGDKSGTSMAAPHVTGVVALMREMHPSWSADQIRTELKNNAADLGATGFDNNTGWGLVRVPATGSSTITITASPAARSLSVQQGGNASGDNAAISLSGTNASTTTWSATKRHTWITFTTASGTGSGFVTWNRSAAGLTVGTYVDTITVSAAGAATPAIVYDTLKITAPVTPVTIAVAPAGRAVSVQQGTAAASDNATITLSGTNATATTWSATRKQSWTTLTNASGTGSGTVSWNRNSATLAVGVYVDTITISATGVTSAVVFDTIRVTAAPTPVVISLTPPARNISVQQGNVASGDNATVTLTGTNAASTNWTVSKKQSWTGLVTTSGTGSGSITWNRNANGLAVGTYVDTITVAASGVTPAVVYDTLRITAAPVPVVIAVSPAARSISVQQGNVASGDNATVTLTGTNAPSTNWTATKKQSWTSLVSSSGTGSGTVVWNRNATGLGVGTYVDTITVSAAGVPSAFVFDTLKITAAPVPLVITMSAASRSITVQQGSSLTSDYANVTLSGTNSSSASWTASKRQSWLTLLSSSGTGSGSVTWTRNPGSLAPGTYVDTINVAAAGATSAVVFDTMKITAAPTPVVLAVSPTGRSVTVQQGTVAPGDNSAVTLTGTNASSTAWSASHRQPWLTLVSASGTGSGYVVWNVNANGLSAGTYVDTISVTAVGVAGVSIVYDTLRITAAPVPITVALASASRAASVQQGAAAPGDNVSVTLNGTGALGTAWTATKRQPWTTLVTAAGIGNGSVAWTRNATGLAVGTYVDTITVSAVGAALSQVVYDTLRITAAPASVVMTVAPLARSITVPQGTAPSGDNFYVTLTGSGASTASWTATHRHDQMILIGASGVGSGYIVFGRSATGLGAGTYVDTVTITAAGVAGSPFMVFDTLRITAVTAPVTLSVAPAGRAVAVQSGTAAPGDNAAVTLTGTDGGTTNWTATKKKSWTTLTNSAGTGSATLTWTRNATGLSVGTYVDTITVSAAGITGSPATIFDTLRITAGPNPVVIAVTPAARSVTVAQGSVAPSDNALVQLTGTNGSTTTWTSTHRQSWLILSHGAGTGSGTLTWDRNAAGLAAGLYVDTITVAAAGATGSPATIFDTLRITPVVIPIVVSVSPASRNVLVQQGGNAPDDNATVIVSGTNATSTAWQATNTKSWLSFATSAATGNGAIVWHRNASGLAAGTYVDTITVTPVGVSAAPVRLVDTMRVSAAPVPVTVSLSPSARSNVITQGTSGSGDNAFVSLTGPNAESTTWSATHRKGWVSFTGSSGTGNGYVTWNRNASALAVGVYVDTITVTVASGGTSAMVFDTIHVVAAAPIVAVAPGGRKVRTVQFAGANKLSVPDADSALVQSNLPDSVADGGWTATASNARLLLATQAGSVGGYVKWARSSAALDPGLYVDTIAVQMVRDPSMRTQFVDSVEVVAVTLPQPDVAVNDLFAHAGLSADQRIALDRQGNSNGQYDLGDFLAWVTRSHIRLSADVMAKVQKATALQAPVRTASGSGGTP